MDTPLNEDSVSTPRQQAVEEVFQEVLKLTVPLPINKLETDPLGHQQQRIGPTVPPTENVISNVIPTIHGMERAVQLP